MENSTCCICLELFEDSTLGRQWLPCGHVLHEYCVTQMRTRGGSDKCPVCRECQTELTPLQTFLDKALLHLSRGEHAECAEFTAKALDLDSENPYACALLADQYLSGDGLPKDVERAKELYMVADLGGDLDATCNLGCICVEEGNIQEAKKYFMKAHRAGHASGAFQLGVIEQQQGHFKQARTYYEAARRGGHKSAAYNLGTLCLEEDRIEEALELLEEARSMGCADAAMKLGLLSELHDDIIGAHKFYLEGHNGGSIEATYMLGRLFEDKGDTAQARIFFIKAYQHGHEDAAKHLAMLGQDLESRMHAMREQSMALSALQKGPEPGEGLDVGIRIRVLGLKTDQGKCLNDRMGTIVGQAVDSDRLIVQVDGFKDYKLIKPRNVVTAARPFPEQPQSISDSADVISDLAAQHALWRSAEEPSQSSCVPAMNEQVSSALLQNHKPEAGVKVVVLKFSRSPRAFRNALLQSPDLQCTRLALEQRGYSVELDSGAKVFVDAELYEPLLEAVRLADWVAYPEHVIVNPDLESKVLAIARSLPKTVIDGRPKREKVLPRGKTTVPLAFATAVATSEHEIIVSKTFIHVKVPSSMRSSDGTGQRTVSTTETNARKGRNHRKGKSGKRR
eukprot:TRINITY_DN22098_c0_g1_i1.p1 TRINITY_DN22098_c0_g1~~TRINITY_DN22098_c0_g1_i1.p1  ORF type:complete len:673 (+),score=140.99 TRINITY_DN22098_c0_g1_i1:156-2021(+)